MLSSKAWLAVGSSWLSDKGLTVRRLFDNLGPSVVYRPTEITDLAQPSLIAVGDVDRNTCHFAAPLPYSTYLHGLDTDGYEWMNMNIIILSSSPNFVWTWTSSAGACTENGRQHFTLLPYYQLHVPANTILQVDDATLVSKHANEFLMLYNIELTQLVIWNECSIKRPFFLKAG